MTSLVPRHPLALCGWCRGRLEGPTLSPTPRMCDGSLRPGEGEPPPAAPPAGRPVEGNERGGGLPWAAPRPAAQDSWGFARAAAAGASGESEAAERPVGARHLGGCTANAHSRLHPHVPGGIGPTHSRPGVGLRPVSAAGSRCRCSRLTRGSRVAHASRGHHPRPRIPRPAPPRGVCSAFLPGSQEVPTPHPTVLLLSCPPPPRGHAPVEMPVRRPPPGGTPSASP